MTFHEIAALLRRHIFAVLAVLLIAGAAGYRIEARPPVYSENGNVVFTVTRHLADLRSSPSQSALLGQSLIAVEGTVADALSPPMAAATVQTVAGTAQYTLALFNSYNLEYPDYSLPSAVLTVTAGSPSLTRRAFHLVFSLIAHRLTALQARALVPMASRIRVYTAASSGPVRQSGSRLRVMAAMAVLTTVAVFVVAGSLDRRRRPASRRRAPRGRAWGRWPLSG
jgi:hypothetical protein